MLTSLLSAMTTRGSLSLHSLMETEGFEGVCFPVKTTLLASSGSVLGSASVQTGVLALRSAEPKPVTKLFDPALRLGDRQRRCFPSTPGNEGSKPLLKVIKLASRGGLPPLPPAPGLLCQLVESHVLDKSVLIGGGEEP